MRAKSVGTIVLILAAMSAMSAWTASAKDMEDADLKALFIARIVQFVEWPDGTFTSGDPIRIGILGKEDLGPALEELLGDQKLQGRSVVIESLDEVEPTSDIHIIVVTKRLRSLQRRTIRTLSNLPVVTVGPSFEFAEYGGTIGMELHRGKVAFEVNLASARKAGLRISSRVLKLATTVY